MFTSLFISILFFTITASASVKREEFTGTTSTGNNPVYSPSSSTGYLSSASSSSSNSNSNSSPNMYVNTGYQYSAASASTGQNDNLNPSSSNNYPNQANSGNLYYYYYPVQEKPKESMIQTSASNQYSSAITTNNGDSATGSDSQTSSTGQDLSYSAQGDSSYNNAGMSDLYSSQNGGHVNNNYDPSSVNTIASQYGYGVGSTSNIAYSPSGPNYAGTSSSYSSGIPYSIASDGSSGTYSSSGVGNSVVSNGINPSYSSMPENSGMYQNLGMNYQGYRQPYPGPYRPSSIPYGTLGSYGSASAPQATYEAPTGSSASGLKKYGISSIIMPMLALAGLSLLIPTVSSISTAVGRKKRSVDSAKESALGEYLERIDRYYALYKTAMQRDECMNRIICELGDTMGIKRVRSSLLNFAEKFSPLWISKRIGALKSAATSNDKPGKCKKYSCQ